MRETLEFALEWESLGAGSSEERATFAAVGIVCNGVWLTEADDAFVKRVRQKVHLSAYRLAEWFAWNWWRLRWEPKRRSTNWAMAHKMATIGGGYVWPNITIASDGERVILSSSPSPTRPSEPLRYISNAAGMVEADTYDSAVDALIGQVIGQLHAECLHWTNCEEIWKQVLEERSDEATAHHRRLEALLGADPDEADSLRIEGLIHDSATLGASGVDELAAAELASTSSEISDIASRSGFEARLGDVVRLAPAKRAALPTGVEAWERAVFAARSLREQEKLGHGPISDDRLSQLAGVQKAAVVDRKSDKTMSFAFSREKGAGSVVFRSPVRTSRRFDLARLLGDRIAAPPSGRLVPATPSFTYRQKLQRAFAGEFLCPFNSLTEYLDGNFSEEAQSDAAEHFQVSSLTVWTLLANHGVVETEQVTRRGAA